MNFINYSELAGLSTEGFDKTEVINSTSGTTKTTTIYGGKASVPDPDVAASRSDWEIRRLVIFEDGDIITITRMWSKGSWTDRATLTYKYQ